MPAVTTTGTSASHLNMSDIPELMPGAKPGANPAERHEFEERCKALHEEAEEEQAERFEHVRLGSGAGATVSDLEAMFPALDASLVRALAADAPTPQHAFETLLALAAATAEVPTGGGEAPRATTPPPLDLKTSDLERFPTLGGAGLQDKDGWQVVSRRDLERDANEDLGSAWRDRAKEAAPKPSAWGPREQAIAPARRKPKESASASTTSGVGVQHESIESDYDFRQRAGQRRAKNIAQYGRGRAGKGRGKGSAEAGASEGEEEEDFEDGGYSEPTF